MSSSGRFVKGFAPLQDGLVLAAVAFIRGREADTAMAVFPVIPTHETGDPLTGALRTLERFLGKAGMVLASLEQGLRLRVVVTDGRAIKGRHNAQPLQGSQQSSPFHGGAVVRVQDQRVIAPLSGSHKISSREATSILTQRAPDTETPRREIRWRQTA